MAYIRYKEVAKHFDFKKIIDNKKLPSYVLDYVYDDEILLAAYRVGRDHGIITTKKIVLFDYTPFVKPNKAITIIPYRAVSTHSIIFYKDYAKFYMLLDSGNPLLLRFSNLSSEDKVRLRLLCNAISAAICNQEIPKKVIDRIIHNDLGFKKDKED